MKFVTSLLALLCVQGFRFSPTNAETAKSWEEYASKLLELNEEVFKHFEGVEDIAEDEGSKNYHDFPCKTFESKETPTSVHRLRPTDVKVVAALGDSITAANGLDAKTIIGVLTQYRGKSWSIGGEASYETVPTLPNVLRKYNPDVIGYSVGTGGERSRGNGLNEAVPGGISVNMPGQARELVDKMREDEKIDFDNDWKVVTLFIGGNDLCRWCNNQEKFAPETYANNIKEALDILHAEVPRAFVNLVSVVRVTQIARVHNQPLCDIVHRIICECGRFGHEGELEPIIDEYHRLTDELMTSGRYDTREDFTVVVQPAFKHTEIPERKDGGVDLSYLAPDCFHFSAKGHAAAAQALWNNMIEPVWSKREQWSPGEPIECLSEENPFFYTMLNSPPGLPDTKPGEHEPGVNLNDRPWQQVAPMGNSFNMSPESCLVFAGAALAVVVMATVLCTLAVVRVRNKRKSTLRQKEKQLLADY